ncbi:hypothetical protein [Nocardia brasiliensis]|uniref:hypothetical protein n=1 Tax=Nocardia brasiliensis TaxID=37326 RepID=UPI002454943C|nr:hypothetical protein [Nocardia brasiliensis]
MSEEVRHDGQAQPRNTVRRLRDSRELAEYIEEIVAQAPPLTAATRAKLSSLLGGGRSRRAA